VTVLDAEDDRGWSRESERVQRWHGSMQEPSLTPDGHDVGLAELIVLYPTVPLDVYDGMPCGCIIMSGPSTCMHGQ